MLIMRVTRTAVICFLQDFLKSGNIFLSKKLTMGDVAYPTTIPMMTACKAVQTRSICFLMAGRLETIKNIKTVRTATTKMASMIPWYGFKMRPRSFLVSVAFSCVSPMSPYPHILRPRSVYL